MKSLKIETTAAEVASELRRHGIGADERVTLMITSPEGRAPGRMRAAVSAVGLTDDDIDRLIEHAWGEMDQNGGG